MKFGGICITTNNVSRLAGFYKTVLQEEPIVEGSHHSFSQLAIWNPGDVKIAHEKHIWLQFYDSNIDELYERLLREIPDIVIVTPPERKLWGAYSFWFQDPDGNKIAVAEVAEN